MDCRKNKCAQKLLIRKWRHNHPTAGRCACHVITGWVLMRARSGDFLTQLGLLFSIAELDDTPPSTLACIDWEIKVVKFDSKALSQCYSKYCEYFSILFRYTYTADLTSGEDEFGRQIFLFGWTLFLYAKGLQAKLFDGNQEKLVINQHLTINSVSQVLLCVIDFLIHHVSDDLCRSVREGSVFLEH